MVAVIFIITIVVAITAIFGAVYESNKSGKHSAPVDMSDEDKIFISDMRLSLGLDDRFYIDNINHNN